MQPLLLRVDEVARLIRLGKSKTWELVNQGEIPSVKIGKSRRVPAAALHAWITTQTEEQTDQTVGKSA